MWSLQILASLFAHFVIFWHWCRWANSLLHGQAAVHWEIKIAEMCRTINLSLVTIVEKTIDYVKFVLVEVRNIALAVLKLVKACFEEDPGPDTAGQPAPTDSTVLQTEASNGCLVSFYVCFFVNLSRESC